MIADCQTWAECDSKKPSRYSAQVERDLYESLAATLTKIVEGSPLSQEQIAAGAAALLKPMKIRDDRKTMNQVMVSRLCRYEEEKRPDLNRIAAVSEVLGYSFDVRFVPNGAPRTIDTTEQGEEAARLVEALPSPEVGRNPRELALRFLRAAHAVDDRGWDSLDLIVHHAEVAIAAAAARKEG